MHLRDLLRIYVMHICVIFMLLICVVKSQFTRQWAVQIDGDLALAKKIAAKNGFIHTGQIFNDIHTFEYPRLAKRSLTSSPYHHNLIIDEPAVKWAEQQIVKRRVKRDFQPPFEAPTRVGKVDRRREEEHHFVFSDPKWPFMWYLNRGDNLDMNVEKAWLHGYTGKGVVVTILDDGLEKDHPDLVQNYDPYASYDVNGQDPDPEPRYDLLDSNRHGTRCAGEVAADANNSICAVGVAYEASVGGVRMLDGDVTDAVEARSLALNPQHIDIYSASWGPDDDGKTVDGPGQLATRAFIEGIKRGRKGKGSIFVWASGNGGRDQDNCNCDGYTNAIWTLSISSATEKGRVPWYSEACSSTLASTYSSGDQGEKMIVTTDLHHKCTSAHTGTSASAPLAAGICALALQANNDLTWRDMQHIVVRTARPENMDSPDWQTNGVGRKVSHRFGYGLMDAYGMVELAKNWTTVPPQRRCEVPAAPINKLIPQKSFVTLTLEVSDCPGVNYLEHVQSKISLVADRRGDIEIYLISPAGTKSNLLAKRPRDNSRSGFNTWPFMTVHMWGESPLGIWKLEIHNNGLYYSQSKATVKKWNLSFHGTETKPGQIADNIVSKIGNNIDNFHHVVNSHLDDSDEAKTEVRGSDIDKKDPKYGVVGIDDHGSVSHPSSSAAGRSPTPMPIPVLSDPKLALPMACASIDVVGSCLECSAGFYMYRSKCVKTCPQRSFINDRSTVKLCSECHYSCLSCSGAYDNQCLKCWPDATLSHPRKGDSFCYATSLLTAYEHQSAWLRLTVPIFLLLAFFVFCLALFVLRNRNGPHNSSVVVDSSSRNGAIESLSLPKISKPSYYPVAVDDSDKLLSNVPFRDSSSSDEEAL